MTVSVEPTHSVSAAIDSLTVSNTGGPYTVTGANVPWLTTSNVSFSPTWTEQSSAKITLNGPNADIEVNGESLLSMIKGIEQRLNILTINPRLESEWAELRSLSDQYRKLEADIETKMKIWDAVAK